MENQKSKSIANVAHNIKPPYADESILEFYKGYYDCVYIIFHPFLRITHPDKINFGLISWPTKEDITNFTEKLSWIDFLRLSDIPDLNRLDIALRNSVFGLKEKHKNDEDLNNLNAAIEKYNLISPDKGNFSDILVNEMLNALEDLGHEWIYIGDEFGFERKIEFIEDIIHNKVQTNYFHETWYTTMNEILYATHWDSHFTFLCADRLTIEKILKKYPFEGFYCNAETVIYWSINSKI